MLQDIEAGRAPDIDALAGSVVELGRLTQTAMPHIDTVQALGQASRQDRGGRTRSGGFSQPLER